MTRKLSFFVSATSIALLSACGGGSSSSGGDNPTPPQPPENTGYQIDGKLVASTALFEPQSSFALKAVEKVELTPVTDVELWAKCGDLYLSSLPESDWNYDSDNDGIADINITDKNGFPYFNLDLDRNGTPELNQLPGELGVPINVDMDCDKAADLNINVTLDSLEPKANVDTNRDLYPDLNFDTNPKDGWPDTHLDIDGDWVADINLDIDGDQIADIDIDTNGDYIPDINIDIDGDLIADRNIDIDGDGIPDYSYSDTDGVILANAEITLEGEFSTYTTTSDENGEFKFERIETGSYNLTAYAEGGQKQIIWAKESIYLAEDISLGAFRMHQDPLLTKVTVNGQVFEQNYTRRVSLGTLSTPVAAGDTVSVSIEGEDPNNRPLEGKFSAHLGGGYAPFDSNGTSMEYTLTQTDTSIPSLHFIADVNNDDNHLGMDGSRDTFVDFYLNSSDASEPEAPTVSAIKINGELVEVPNPSYYFSYRYPNQLSAGDSINMEIVAEHPTSPIEGRFDHSSTTGERTTPGMTLTYTINESVPYYTHYISHWTLVKDVSSQQPVTTEVIIETKTDAKPTQAIDILLDGQPASEQSVRAGETYELSVQYEDPNGLPVECSLHKSGNWDWGPEESVISDWSPTCSIPYTFNESDAVEAFEFRVWLRNNDALYSDGSGTGMFDARIFRSVKVSM